MTTTKIILSSFAITAGLIKGAPVGAEAAPVDLNVSIVHIADLNLSNAAGRAQLDQRLVIAAHEVCGTASDADLAGQNDVRDCRHRVLADARAQANRAIAARGEDIKVATGR